MNNKGQALIEFVLILPVFLMILFVIVDFGTIMNHKNNLETISSDIVDRIKNEDNLEEINKDYKNIKITSSSYKEKYKKVLIEEDIHLITPGANRVLDNPFKIKIERIINES